MLIQWPLAKLCYGARLLMQQLIGVGVIIKNDGKILLGKRIGSHGAGTWGLPGGHLEPGEEVEVCS